VEDIAEAVVLAVLDDRAAGRVYNVSETHAMTEAEWVRKDRWGAEGRLGTPCGS
jgi:hypothetical protein